MAISDADIAAQLIERLLTDTAFRAQFRRDPAAACRDAGLDDLAQEMSLGAGNAMMTLDVRESRSSLAGVMMAAAMEGVGVFQFAQHVAPALGDVDNAIGDVLSRVHLPAISLPGRGALSGGPDAPAPAVAKEEPEAPVAAPPPPAPPAPEPEPEPKKDPKPPPSPDPEPPKPDPAAEAAKEAAAEIAESEKPDLPSSTDLPEAADLNELGPAPESAETTETAPEGADPPPEPPPKPPPSHPGGPPATGDPVPVEVQPMALVTDPVSRAAPDPDLYGLDGPGSPMTPEIEALLENPKVKFDEVGIADLKAGKIDPRVVAALTKISQEHEITVTCMCSDHARMSASGNVSNHAYGRGVDIGTIDGEIVRPNSPAARELAAAMMELDPDYRPDEIGTPFAIAAPGYFTDAAHQDHIHLGFKQPIESDWTPPPDVAASGSAGASQVGLAERAGVSGAPETPSSDSGTFMAVTPETEARGQQAHDSGTFMAVQPVVGPPGAIADPSAVPGAVFDAAANSAVGSSSLGAKALEIAETQKGVREVGGANLGAQVGEYQAVTGAGPGTPWCASFVTWSLEKAGHKMDGGGWAAVATWVQAAREGKHDLQFISPDQARPGDIAVYDWGGQEDFGADGHIGFVASEVKDGKFTALEGNQGDMVQEVPRAVGQGGANVKFIRIGADAPAGAGLGAGGTPVVDHTVAADRAGATPIPTDAGEAAPSRPPDPSEYGREGTGGPMTPEIKALLENPNVKFDEVGIQDLKEGKIDPRAIAVLTKLSQEHEITVTCMCSDHPRGPGSNHYYGRGVDIGSIDGEIVRPGSAAARDLASEIAELSGTIKPSEVGTPFAIASPGYFTDAAHQDHIHIGWDEPITPDWKPPAELAVGSRAGGAAELAPAAGAPPPAGDSGAFMAVTPESTARAGGATDSGAFMAVRSAVVEPPPGNALTGSERIDLSAIGDGYPGDDAPKEQLAAWLAREAEKRGLPPQLPVMAALVESGVRNLNYGDADSVGFFQMRVGIWNKGEYAGFPERPELQAKWFLDQAEQVKKQRLAAGKSIDDPKQFGEWVADIERPAEQYRYKYGLRLQEANNLLKQASATGAGRSAPAPPALVETPAVTPAPPPPPAPDPQRVAARADEPPASDSGTFMAVDPDRRSAAAASDSQAFLRAVTPDAGEPPPPPPAPAFVLPAVDPSAVRSLGGEPVEPFDPDLAAVDPEYPGDDAPKDEIAKWMAREASARGIPPELPVMAALVESNLQNLDHGHSTSLGYFQMLEHFWNQGEYKGYPDNPRLQLKWFLDTAEQVKQQRVAAGKPIDDPRHYGEWIADVEKPAAQYRGRYQLRLAEARRLLR